MNTSVSRSAIAVLLLIAALGLAGCQDGGTMTSIRMVPENATIARGTAQQFTAVAVFSNGITVNWTSAAVWSSSDPSAVSVNNTPGQNGIATSLSGTGTFQITATEPAKNFSTAATLIVADPVSISILPAAPHMAKATSYQFALEAVLTGPTVTQNIASFATWTTRHSTIATVSSTGLVTAGSFTGITTIDASFLISAATTTLIVTDTPVDSITITTDAAIPLKLFAWGNYVAGGPLDFTRSVTWTSSNSSVATIDKEGAITPVGSGTATFTATDPISGKSDSSEPLYFP